MKIVLTILSFVLVFSAGAQMKYTYYLTGRPFSVERNNAILTVGSNWKIDFVYAGNDVIEMNGFEKIQTHNDSVSKLIGTTTQHGEEWFNIFYSEVDTEEAQQQKMRTWIKDDLHFAEIEAKLIETFILFHQKKGLFGIRYQAFLVGQEKTDLTRTFATHAVYKVKVKKKKLKCTDTSIGKLPFTLPQNGIL